PPTTASLSCASTSRVSSWLEPQLHRKPEAAARWIRRDIDVSRDGLVTEVAHFRIHAGVRRDREEIAPADAHPAVSSALPQAVDQARRQLVRQRNFPQLEETGAFDVVLGHHLEARKAVLSHGFRAARTRVGVIRS